MITNGDLTEKPGWVRISIHPTTTDKEAAYIADSIISIVEHSEEWSKKYAFNKEEGDFVRIEGEGPEVPNLIEDFAADPA